MSKLLTNLNAAIELAPDESARSALLAKKAGYLARLGAFDEAQAIIAQLRTEIGDGHSPRALIWTMLAEGLLYTYRDMANEGADRIMRANLLASASRDRPLIAATSTWRAHLQSERSEFQGMARSIDDAFANCESTDHEILSRLYMTLANARMSIGDRIIANELYMFARHHALECGDQATIDALIYNKAAFALAWLRARACFGESSPELLRQLRVEINSAKTYQQLANVSALSNFVFLWEARLLLLAQEYESAIPALESVREMQPFARYNYHRSLINLEIGYCQSRGGLPGLDKASISATAADDLDGLHEDEQMVGAWLRHEIVTAQPELGDLAAAREQLMRARARFDSSCTELRQVLEGMASHPHIRRPQVASPKSPG